MEQHFYIFFLSPPLSEGPQKLNVNAVGNGLGGVCTMWNRNLIALLHNPGLLD